MATANAPVRIDMALQGGGSHGAFTWGVIDRLVEEEALAIAALSGASAGAMNAVVTATGLAHGGPDGAKAALHSFWRSVHSAAHEANPIFALIESFPEWFSATAMWWNVLSGGFVTLAHSPNSGRHAQALLRQIIADHIDLDALRDPSAPRLFVAATSARTGAARIFRNDDISVDAVLASACLPLAFPPVTIDGEDYWDGGYSANPPLTPLIQESPHSDLLLVTVNPITRTATPLSPDTIPDRISEMTFNQSLLKEIRGISMLKAELGTADSSCQVPLIPPSAHCAFTRSTTRPKWPTCTPSPSSSRRWS